MLKTPCQLLRDDAVEDNSEEMHVASENANAKILLDSLDAIDKKI